MKLKRLNIKMDEDIHAHLKSKAAARGKTIQQFVWDALFEKIAPLPLKRLRKAKP